MSYLSSLEANTKENLCESNLLGGGSQESKRKWDAGPEREGGQAKSTEGDWHRPTGSSRDSVSMHSVSLIRGTALTNGCPWGTESPRHL